MTDPNQMPSAVPNKPLFTRWTYDLPENEYDKADALRLFREVVATTADVDHLAEESVTVRVEPKAIANMTQTTYAVSGRLIMKDWGTTPQQ